MYRVGPINITGGGVSAVQGRAEESGVFARTVVVCGAEGLLDKAAKMGDYIFDQLGNMAKELDVIKEVRGIGLMIGIELKIPATETVKKCMDAGLLLNCTHDTVIRIMPQLNVKQEHIDEGLGILKDILESV